MKKSKNLLSINNINHKQIFKHHHMYTIKVKIYLLSPINQYYFILEEKMHSRSRRQESLITSDIKRQFTNFLQNFEEVNPKGSMEPKYLRLIRQMIDQSKHLLVISHQDFITYNNELANLLFDDFYKYENLVNSTLTQFIKELQKNQHQTQELRKDEQKDDKYEVTFDSGLLSASSEESSVRDLRCDRLGKLISFRGTITRTTEVRPELNVGVFICKQCGTFSKPTIQQFKYTEPRKCLGRNCDKSVWELNIAKSQFSDFQKLRVQQDPTKIPPGAMPRSIDIIIRNDNIEKGQPGDICKFVGYLCVQPEVSSMLRPGEKTTLNQRNMQTRGQMMEMQGVQGLKGIRQLNYRLIFTATNLIVENNQFREEQHCQDDDEEDLYDGNNKQNRKQEYNQDVILQKVFSRLTEQQIMMIKQLKDNPNLYDDLANSLFPSIFGQTEIKKALLLQLFGGIHKITSNKISIRGDLNILIVGDPSTAKSQFLKAVNKFVPRSVYTNGKTTSAAGLTASVTRDDSGNVGIEAGALMLADNGICCIDEFDKMNINDQVAIHEAMEQQTISIAKAGVYATLNARTSILAAANPLFGRYDKSKSLKHNINITPPLMSRFDLFFVVCDQANDGADAHLGGFIINMHRNKEKAIVSMYDAKSIKLYISTAKKLKPMITHEAAQLFRKYYKQMRQKDKNLSQMNSYRVTVRQLQSMIRISQALARLHLDTQVKGSYVREAYRLITSSIMKLQKSPITLMEEEEMMYEEQIRKLEKQHKGNIALQKELKQKKQQKKSKQVSISHELYQQILRNVLQLFKNQKQIEKQMDDDIQIDQQSLVSYLLGVNFEAGMVSSEEQSNQMRKIINAVIKKLIRQERVLMVVEDHENAAKRVLRIHPNFVF